MALPVQVQFHGFEPPVPFAQRLAAANGYPSFKLFLRTAGISAEGLARGETQEIGKLARWSGVSPGELSHYAVPKTKPGGDWKLGHAIFSREARLGNRIRFCPVCVVEDLERSDSRPIARPFVRTSWMTRSVKCCTSHRCKLIEVEATPKSKLELTRHVSTNLDVIRLQAAKASPDQSVELDIYLEWRIRGDATHNYLDRFEANVAVELCTYLGQFIRKHRVTILPQTLRHANAREIGYYIACKGEIIIQTAVAEILNAKRPAGTYFSFGNLGRWLRANANKPEYADILEVFQEVAERTLPFGEGDLCFIPVRRRYKHSIISASREYGLLERRVLHLVSEAGLVEDTSLSPSQIWFSADDAHELLLAATQTVTSVEARTELGISEVAMDDLLKAGLIPRVETRDNRRNFTRIARDELDDFKRKLFDNTDKLRDDDSRVPIATVCRKCGCKFHEVISLILEGKVSGAGAPEDHDYRLDRLKVNPDPIVRIITERRTARRKEANGELLSTRQANARLCVHPHTVSHLIRLGLLDTVVTKNPSTNFSQTYVDAGSVRRFQTKYISLAELARIHETHPMAMSEFLTDVGVHPIYERTGRVARFYRRAEVADIAFDRS